MQKIKAPLTLLTSCVSVGFLDGALGLDLSDDLYVLVGFAMIAGLIWAWVVVSKN